MNCFYIDLPNNWNNPFMLQMHSWSKQQKYTYISHIETSAHTDSQDETPDSVLSVHFSTATVFSALSWVYIYFLIILSSLYITLLHCTHTKSMTHLCWKCTCSQTTLQLTPLPLLLVTSANRACRSTHLIHPPPFHSKHKNHYTFWILCISFGCFLFHWEKGLFCLCDDILLIWIICTLWNLFAVMW